MLILPLLNDAGVGHCVWAITTNRPNASLEQFTKLLLTVQTGTVAGGSDRTVVTGLYEPSQPFPLTLTSQERYK